MTNDSIKRRVIGLVGSLSDEEIALFFGRYSALRRYMRESGQEHLLMYDPPPLEQDPTVGRAIQDAQRRARNLARCRAQNAKRRGQP